MNGRIVLDSDQANFCVDDNRFKEQSLQQAQDVIYQFLIDSVNQSSPETVLQEFKQLFVLGNSLVDPKLNQALNAIISQKNETDFINTLKRACYILINNWSSKRKFTFIQKLIKLLADSAVNPPKQAPNLNRLRTALVNFVNSQDYQGLKLFASPSEEKKHWSHRYTFYLLVPQYLDSRNPVEQREIARNLSKRLKKKFKFELAMYTARCDSPNFKETEINNPTQLGDLAIKIIKKVGAQHLLFNQANYANLFTQQIQNQDYKTFKKSLKKYLLFSISNSAHLEILDTQLSAKLDNLYTNYHSKPLTVDLLLRTCKRVIGFLTTEDSREPSSLFILLTTHGSSLIVAIALFRIIRICKYAQTHLEFCIAHLIRYYEGSLESDCKWLIHFLEIFNIIFAVYNADVQYNLVKIKSPSQGSGFDKNCDIDNLKTYRIFSQLKGSDLRSADLSGIDIRSTDLSAADLRDAELSGADLSQADLSLAKLSGANLSGAILNQTELSSAMLNGANLSGASLAGADLRCADLRQANLNHATLTAAKLRRADLQQANLREANLWGASLDACELRDADLHHADLSNANLSNANLSNANLSNANLRSAQLCHSKLHHANLSEADLDRANCNHASLSGANLSHANLTRTDLSHGNLRHADLTEALLRHVNLKGANLSHANLTGANLFGTNLSDVQVTGAYFRNNSGLSEEMKRELIQKGAVVEVQFE
ncbi:MULTISPECIES: pentapeptide repeat-containing protein [unclassified Coleofasciculus]|uniref:pentapeptide repeat-containing protein n=1 Tax=unclassified Coleofasciculus TaxID=2692782 RepID=UPI0018810F52|nr:MULTISPECIES: pentapeptide repeat-containing protein [unclassified Coleofasciculus]MBE9125193.1 pentapeptide repeat-containing protein [Coleofasciculus sp. LEGE 07081]MBE9148770.1 pentapeptide repeat-containing protein [Coleofasciculus sp. LEGE 07092]